MHAGVKDISKEGYFRNWCKEVKSIIDKPTILSGGLRSYELISEIIEKVESDLVGMCRPFIREPHLINRLENGDYQRAACISCNKCITELLVKNRPLECCLDKQVRQESETF